VDEFWTAEERAFRDRAARFFEDHSDPRSAGTPASSPGEIWRGLEGLADEEAGPAAVPAARLSRRVAALDEAARRDPRLGAELYAWLERSASLDPPRRAACELGRLAGTAAHVFASGTVAARERGYFSSILMDFRAVQERLAGLAAGAELARLGACRLVRLLERGDTLAAGRETSGLEARARVLAADIRAVSGSLLGPAWTAERLPAEAAQPPLKGPDHEA
jgi:hypothetical protein